MITDYCHGDKEEHSEDFVNYVLQRGYHLMSVPQYGQLLEEVRYGGDSLSVTGRIISRFKIFKRKPNLNLNLISGWLRQCYGG